MQADTRLGPYLVRRLLGAGGMGNVYLAEDSRLDRPVAIKVLPPELASDPERMGRLEREARLLAQLEHPNVAAIYGFEELAAEGGTAQPCLVMQYVPGRTVAERLEAGPLPLEEALDIARQVAAGVGAAHDRGIVHRDLKPGNVMLSEEAGGETRVKVLDFGLAKDSLPARTSSDSGGSASDLTSSPTRTAATAAGLVLGTAAYMSPEQARGKTVDRRSDVWAFGCLIYEMLAGRKAFPGGTVSDILASILKDEPDWSALPAKTPRRVRRALERCLTKDVAARPYDVRDVALDLREPEESEESPEAVARTSSGLGPRGLALAIATALLLGIPAGLLISRLTIDTARERQWAGPHDFRQLTTLAGAERFPGVSADGEWIVYASRVDGDWDIYLQGVGGENPINLTASSSDDDTMPALSPDGRRIAFRSERDGGGIFVMGRTGESVRRVAEEGFNPAWSPDGARLAVAQEAIDETPYARNAISGLSLVDLETGVVRGLETGDAVQPSWSSDGQRLVYWGLQPGSGQRDLWTVSVDGGAPVPLTDDPSTEWTPIFAPDGRRVIFSSDRDGTLGLWSLAIDDSGRPVAPPRRVLAGSAHWLAYPSLTGDGRTLVYSVMHTESDAYSVVLEPPYRRIASGPTLLTRGSRTAVMPDLSPDGEWLAYNTGDGQQEDLFLERLDGTATRRLTEDEAKDRAPRFSPDGRRLLFYSDRSGQYRVWTVEVDGSGLRELPTSDGDHRYPNWSPDGTMLSVDVDAKVTQRGTFGNFICRLEPGPPLAVAECRKIEPSPPEGARFEITAWSPDGRFVAGTFRHSSAGFLGVGIHELDPETTRVLTDFGRYPVVLGDGQHLLFYERGDLLVYSLESGETWPVLSDDRGHINEYLSRQHGSDTIVYSFHQHEDDVWMARWDAEDPEGTEQR